MNRLSCIFLILMLATSSCHEQAVQKPLNLLDEEKMTAVLTEIEILEAAHTTQLQRNDTSRAMLAPYYSTIFTQQNITREAFEESYRWYSAEPERMMKVRSQVHDELSKKLAELSKLLNPAQDSLKSKTDTTSVNNKSVR